MMMMMTTIVRLLQRSLFGTIHNNGAVEAAAAAAVAIIILRNPHHSNRHPRHIANNSGLYFALCAAAADARLDDDGFVLLAVAVPQHSRTVIAVVPVQKIVQMYRTHDIPSYDTVLIVREYDMRQMMCAAFSAAFL